MLVTHRSKTVTTVSCVRHL